MKNEVLLIPEKIDSERDSVAEIWEQLGGNVVRIGKFWNKPELERGSRLTIYGNDTFSLVLAQVLSVNLIMPKDELIAELKPDWLKRNIEIIELKNVRQLDFPVFIKPVKPKIFKSSIYDSLDQFKENIEGIEDNELVIVSDVINVEKEVRSFILDNVIQDLAYYEGQGDIQEPKDFIEEFLKDSTIKFPRTYVLDIGFNEELGWFIIEFNSSWGAGLNYCDPKKVLDCIKAATEQ